MLERGYIHKLAYLERRYSVTCIYRMNRHRKIQKNHTSGKLKRDGFSLAVSDSQICMELHKMMSENQKETNKNTKREKFIKKLKI